MGDGCSGSEGQGPFHGCSCSLENKHRVSLESLLTRLLCPHCYLGLEQCLLNRVSDHADQRHSGEGKSTSAVWSQQSKEPSPRPGGAVGAAQSGPLGGRSVSPWAWCTCVEQSRALASGRPEPLGRVPVWRGKARGLHPVGPPGGRLVCWEHSAGSWSLGGSRATAGCPAA